MNCRGKQIAVLGAGKSGVAAARLAARDGGRVTLRDTGDDERLRELAAQLEAEEKIEVRLGEEALADAGAAALAVISPGIDQRAPLGRVFTDAGVPVIGEIEFADSFVEWPVVAVTGTNGKTTTTEIVAQILSRGGQRTVAAGNYGTAYSDVILGGESYDVITLELSSFQLEGIVAFKPSVSVWLNFAPDHLDRYDSVEDYREAKLRIFANQGPEDFAVINHLDQPGPLAAETVTFSAFSPGADFEFRDGCILYHGDLACDFRETGLRGRHNAENLMAALAVGRRRGLSFESMRASVRDYRPPRHRCELVATVDGRDYINDSKATNAHALEQSLRSQEAPVVLIAGGKDKGLPLGDLAPVVAGGATHVVAIGEIRGQLVEAWEEQLSCEAAEDLETAVALATKAAAPGQTILFSPGTSSFDMYSGYEERGDAFRDILTKQQ